MITLSREETETIVRILRAVWIPPDDQRMIYDLITRLENELRKN